MTWDEVHDRHRLAREILRLVEQQGHAGPVRTRLSEIASTFGSFNLFLKHLEHIWTLETQVHIDLAMERHGDIDQARIGEVVAAQEPAIRLLLETYADHPALRDSPATRVLLQVRPGTPGPRSSRVLPASGK